MTDQGLPKLGHFLCQRILGGGGTGTVYLANDERNGRQVAVKILRASAVHDAEARIRFLREVDIARHLHHPNLVEYLDTGWEGDRPYLVMEWLVGGDAAKLLHRQSEGLPHHLVAAIGRDCARGLAAIHAAGLIHRDIKPSNIFLGCDGRAKLGDLGLAMAARQGSEIATDGHLVGTPEFMAPEQALAGEETDFRADVFSLGSTLFALATGAPPFTGATAWSILAQLLSDTVPDPRTRRPNLPPALARAIKRACARDRSHRHASAEEFAEVLEDILAGRAEGSDGDSTLRILAMKNTNASSGKRILLVDDDPIIRRVYQSRFEQDGYEFITAGDGLTAETIATNTPPDLIILDLMLPDEDGLSLLRRLRRHAGLSDVPMVVFSNAFADEQQELARVAGADRVLAKSACTPRGLVSLAEELLQRFSQPDHHRPPPPPSTHGAFRVDLLQRLATTTVARLQLLLGELDGDRSTALVLGELAGTSHSLQATAAMIGDDICARLSSTIEHLARQLTDRTPAAFPSAWRTLEQALDRLRHLVSRIGQPQAFPTVSALVVDDDPVVLALSSQSLRTLGMDVETAVEAQAGLRLAENRPFTLVVTDVILPGMDGATFAARLRGLPGHEATPVIFLTAATDYAEQLAELKDPTFDVLTKPFLVSELAAKSVLMVTRGP